MASMKDFVDANRRTGSTTLISKAAKSSDRPVWVVVPNREAGRHLVREGVPKDSIVTSHQIQKGRWKRDGRPVLIDPAVLAMVPLS